MAKSLFDFNNTTAHLRAPIVASSRRPFAKALRREPRFTPIDLTNGTVAYSRQNAAAFHATTDDGLVVRIDFGNDSESWNPDHACFACIPGTRLDLSQSESFASNGDDELFFVVGMVRVGSVDYLVDSMNFSIDAGSVIVPDTSGDRSMTLNAGRFLLRGMITGTSEAGVTRVFDLTGSGRTSIN
jgi:hypothetical protein